MALLTDVETDIIQQLSPAVIGRVVAITVKTRKFVDGEHDGYFPGQTETHMGVLQMAVVHNKGIDFRLVGGDKIYTMTKKNQVDMIVYEEDYADS